MKNSAVVHARVEAQTKKQAERVLRKLGMTPSEAIRLYYTQVALHGGIPFPVRIPNNRTRETLRKSGKGQEIKSFDTLDEMFAGWEK